MSTPPDEELKNIERLRWQCRRGMLELDILLEAFLEQHYSGLSPEQQRTFIKLLEYPDPLIHTWCVAGEEPGEEAVKELVKLIRATQVV